MVIHVVLTRVCSGHLVGGKCGQVATRAGQVVAVVWVVSRAVVVVATWGGHCLSLNLVCSLGKHGNVSVAWVQASGRESERGIRVRGRDIG